MRTALIDSKKCKNCKVCKVQEFCDRKAIIREDPSDMPWVDSLRCNGCLKCKDICSAIEDVYHPF